MYSTNLSTPAERGAALEACRCPIIDTVEHLGRHRVRYRRGAFEEARPRRRVAEPEALTFGRGDWRTQLRQALRCSSCQAYTAAGPRLKTPLPRAIDAAASADGFDRKRARRTANPGFIGFGSENRVTRGETDTRAAYNGLTIRSKPNWSNQSGHLARRCVSGPVFRRALRPRPPHPRTASRANGRAHFAIPANTLNGTLTRHHTRRARLTQKASGESATTVTTTVQITFARRRRRKG